MPSEPNNVFNCSNSEFSSANIARQIGNAVPVKLGQVVAKSVKEHLKKLNKL